MPFPPLMKRLHVYKQQWLSLLPWWHRSKQYLVSDDKIIFVPSSPIRQSEKLASVKYWQCWRHLAIREQCSGVRQLFDMSRTVCSPSQASTTHGKGVIEILLQYFKYIALNLDTELNLVAGYILVIGDRFFSFQRRTLIYHRWYHLHVYMMYTRSIIVDLAPPTLLRALFRIVSCCVRTRHL